MNKFASVTAVITSLIRFKRLLNICNMSSERGSLEASQDEPPCPGPQSRGPHAPCRGAHRFYRASSRHMYIFKMHSDRA